jgi:hypothetical protein
MLACASLMLLANQVRAHSAPPTALAVLVEDDMGPRVVRLSAGLARREPDGSYAMLCPAAWGDDLPLPAAAIPGGPVVIAGTRGLYLLDEAGGLSPHPDPAAAGPSLDLITSGDRLYALRQQGGLTQLVRIEPERVSTVFSDAASWSTGAASDEAIVLQSLNGDLLSQVRLDRDGALLGREFAQAPEGAVYVSARASSRALYALVGTIFGRELGRIEAGGFTAVARANAAIAGPVELAGGGAFLAIDTQLAPLVDGVPGLPLTAAPPVSCLGRLGERAYACTLEGVVELGDAGPGRSLFELRVLRPPDLALAAEELRDSCRLQWEHFRFDLLSVGIDVDAAAGANRDAGVAVDGGEDGGRAEHDAGAERLDDGSGCSCGPTAGARAHGGVMACAGGAGGLLLRLARGKRRRRR